MGTYEKPRNTKGRESLYPIKIEPYLDYIYESVFRGVSEKNIAASLNTTQSMFCDYKNKHSELNAIIIKARKDRAAAGMVTLMEFIEAKPRLEDLLKQLELIVAQPWTTVNEFLNYIRFLYPDTDWYRLYKLGEINTEQYNAMTNRMKVQAITNKDDPLKEEGAKMENLMIQFTNNMMGDTDE